MDRLLFPVFVLLAHWLQPRFNARLRFLEAQIRMLRSRVDGNRIVPTPEEKDELLSLGVLPDHDVGEVLHVVQVKAYRRWLRERQDRASFRSSGRPRIPEALRRLVIRFSGENGQWGYRRILGELKKLGFSIGASTIRKILREWRCYESPTNSSLSSNSLLSGKIQGKIGSKAAFAPRRAVLTPGTQGVCGLPPYEPPRN